MQFYSSIEKSEGLAEYLKKHGYKQIDFGNPGALEKLYAAARASRHSCSRFSMRASTSRRPAGPIQNLSGLMIEVARTIGLDSKGQNRKTADAAASEEAAVAGKRSATGRADP